MSVTYPLDLSGVAPSNLVQGELHTTSESRFRDYNFIVPVHAPFFVDNFGMSIVNGNVHTPLVEDVDFSFALPYVTGTRTTGKQMYGAVTIHNSNLNGILSLDYQTVGGDQTVDRLAFLTVLADKAYNPRTTIFDIVTNAPGSFPPVPHYQDYQDFYGQERVVEALVMIRDAILANSSLTQEQINQFLQTMSPGALGNFVNKGGDTMAGPLTLAGSPMEAMHAATKQYVDAVSISESELNGYLSNYHTANYVDAELGKKINKTGDVMTGHLTLVGDPSQDLHPTTKQYVDNIKNNIDLRLNNINTTLTTLAQEHASPAYVDSKIQEVMAYIHSSLINRMS